MPRRPGRNAATSLAPPETLEDRWLLEAQTARNLTALTAEHDGQVQAAIELYEQNVREGFPGDLPYGRLVAIYERSGELDAAERVLRRAIEVFSSSTRRTAADRRATVRVFRNRLGQVLKRKRQAGPAGAGNPAEG